MIVVTRTLTYTFSEEKMYEYHKSHWTNAIANDTMVMSSEVRSIESVDEYETRMRDEQIADRVTG